MVSITKEQIKEIAEQLECGFSVYFHKETGELVCIPDEDQHIGMEMEFWQEDIDKVEENFQDYLQFTTMESGESFEIMADFAEQLTDERLQTALIEALNRSKPFRGFKHIIDHAGPQRQHWFDFKSKRFMEWTEAQLKMHGVIDV